MFFERQNHALWLVCLRRIFWLAHKNWGVTAFLGRRVMLKNRKNLGRRSTWGLTACFVQTQQMKALTREPLRSSRNVKESENSGETQHLGRSSFLGGLRNWGPTHLTCELSICWGGTDPGTHAHRGAAVPPTIISINVRTFLQLVWISSARQDTLFNKLFLDC